MRFFCCYRIKNQEGNIVLKTEVHTTKVDNVEKGTLQLLYKLSTDNNIPAEFVNRNSDDLGILYINPKREHHHTDLGDLDEQEWEAKLDGQNI